MLRSLDSFSLQASSKTIVSSAVQAVSWELEQAQRLICALTRSICGSQG